MSLLVTLLSGAGGGGGGSGSVVGVILSPVVAASTATYLATYANGTAGIGATLTNASASLTAARVATTGALTVVYANGTLGVGATLTNNTTQAAISIDSVALSLNDRVLVKNQAAAAQNGVYSVTTVGTASTNWVLTRVTDFDQAAEMVAGTQVGITAGTTNTGTKWVLSTTITTVGSDAVTFAATAAFSIDGQSPTVGQRVLLKNQTSALQNGIYTVTTVGTASTDWVLTRATDFNQPSQMTAGVLVEVINGTVNASTVQELTTAVAAVGTNSVTFVSINITTKVDQNGSPIYAADSGIADAYVITLSPAPSAYTTGMVVRFKASAANATTTPTINVNGLGAKTIVKVVNTALAANDILASQFVELVYDGTNFVIFSQLGNAAGTTGTLVNVQTFTSGTSQTYTPTSGANNILVKIQGGGGGGGGTAGAAGNAGAGGGGGAGGYVEYFLAGVSGNTYTYTVGGGGAGATGNATGTTGGASIFNGITASAGVGGGGTTFGTGAGQYTLGGAGGAAAGGKVNIPGTSGGPGVVTTISGGGLSLGGMGGASLFGGNAPSTGVAASATNGLAAINYGSGGGGGVSANSASSANGGAGSGGIIVVYEYK